MPQTTARPLPRTIEEITPEWMTAALRIRAPEVIVRDVEVIDVQHGTCTKVRLGLDLDERGRLAGIPDQVMLKGGFEEHSDSMMHLHEVEARAYRDLFPEVDFPTPSSYFADYDEEANNGMVIMEDLALRGVSFNNALHPRSPDEVSQGVRALARFHAATWNSSEFESGRWSWVQPGIPFMRDYLLERYLVPDVWKHYVELPRGAATSSRFHDLEWAKDAMARLARLGERRPHVVLHGDPHVGNTYVAADGSPEFLDPMTRRDSAMWDVSYYTTVALDTADRRICDRDLLREYLEELVRSGVDDAPSFDDALPDYGAYLAYGYLVFLINSTDFLPEAINTACTARFSDAMLDHDTAGRLLEID